MNNFEVRLKAAAYCGKRATQLTPWVHGFALQLLVNEVHCVGQYPSQLVRL